MLITIRQVILRVPMCCCCYSLERSSPTVIILRQAWEYYNSILGLLVFASIAPAKPVSAKTVAYKPGASSLPQPATHPPAAERACLGDARPRSWPCPLSANICLYLRWSRAPLSAAVTQPAQEMAGIRLAHWLGKSGCVCVCGVWGCSLMGFWFMWRWPHCQCVPLFVCVCWRGWRRGAQPDQLAENHRNLLSSLACPNALSHTNKHTQTHT